MVFKQNKKFYENLLVLVFMGMGLFVHASNSTYFFKHYNYEDGLISNTVNAIVQDEDGFMWFGTSEGLCRFDGYGYKTYVNIPGDKNSLNDNFISSVAVDSNRNCIWLVTSTGVSKLDKTTYMFQNYPISDSLRVRFSPFSRGTICVDHNGNVWVEGFSEAYAEGLFKYDPVKDTFINLSKTNKDVPQGISFIYEDKQNQLWIGTNHDLYAFYPETELFKKIAFKNNPIDSLYITCLYGGKDGKLWIGTHHNHAIYLCENDSIELFYESEFSNDDYNWASSISAYDDNTLLVAVKDLGVMTIDLTTGEKGILQPDMYHPNGINSKNPNVIYSDKGGNIWIGTYNNGVNFLDKHKKQFYLYQFNYTPSGLLSNNVRAFFEDSDGDLWVGTKEGGGISRFDPDNGTFENYKADKSKPNWLDNDIVICINELEKGKLLVGTYGGGIYLFDKNKKVFSKFAMSNGSKNSISNKFVYAIYRDLDDQLWIGSNSSVDIYHTRTQTFSHPKGVNYARCFLDNGNAVLIGTWTKGLYVYDKSEKRIENYQFNNPELQKIKNVRINGMAQDNDGYVWMATNKGLLRFKDTKSEELLITEEDGLNNNNICAVLVDDHNNIWASTKNGIVKYNPGTGDSKTYNKYDGLQSNVFEEFVSLKTKSGYMLFSGLNGFNMFYPDSIKDNMNEPKVHITELSILNQPVKVGSVNSPLTQDISLTKKLKLNNIQSSFSFQFVAVNYTSPEKSKYLYKLEGYDTDWRKADERRIASYTRVPSGYYTFKVKASNGDGVWSANTEAIKIRIKPPFSRSAVAFTLYGLLFLGFLIGYRIFVHHNAIQNARLEEEKRENQRLEEINRKRIRFFTNISHELRTPLTLIASPLARLSNYNTHDKQLSSLLHIMNRNAQRLLRIVNQLMDFRRIEENRIQLTVSEADIVAFVQDVLHSFDDIVLNRNIKITFNSNYPDGFVCWFDASILDKVLFNLLSNAFKFSKVNGEISVEVLIENNEVQLKVSDRGIGIAAEDINKIFDRFYTTDQADHQFKGAGVGLSFTKSLVELHHGKIRVTSKLGEGSCFTLIIPVSKDEYNVEERLDEKQESLIENIPENPLEVMPKLEKEPRTKTHKDIILVVEDYDDLREYLVQNLSAYTVLSCANGKEALKLAHEKMPDLILSDVMMPEMDGLELCKQIKTDIITSHIPVVLLTSQISAEQKLEGYLHQADAYIEKPFSIDLLEIQIANLLQLRKDISAKYSGDIVATNVEDGMFPMDKKFLNEAYKIIEAGMDDPNLSVESLSEKMGMSRSQLFRKFKALTNTTPSHFIKIARLKKAAKLLSGKEHNVNEVAIMVGFIDSSHFIATFKKYYGQTPKQFSESI